MKWYFSSKTSFLVITLAILTVPASAFLVEGEWVTYTESMWPGSSTTYGSGSEAGFVSLTPDPGGGIAIGYNPIALDGGRYTLSFDFNCQLLPGSNLDISVLFLEDTSQPLLYWDEDDSLCWRWDDTQTLLGDGWGSGSTSYGTITESNLGEDWSHFTITIDNQYNYVVPFFEIWWYGYEEDQFLSLENISITAVPEPVTALLAGPLILGVGMGRRISRKRSRC